MKALNSTIYNCQCFHPTCTIRHSCLESQLTDGLFSFRRKLPAGQHTSLFFLDILDAIVSKPAYFHDAFTECQQLEQFMYCWSIFAIALTFTGSLKQCHQWIQLLSPTYHSPVAQFISLCYYHCHLGNQVCCFLSVVGKLFSPVVSSITHDWLNFWCTELQQHWSHGTEY